MISKSIAVIEPDHDTRVELRKLLESKGHYVISVTRGRDFLDLMDSITVPSLMFVSNKLLFMEAQDLINIVRKNPGYAKTPIIEISDGTTLTLDGTVLLITRPFNPAECLRCIEEVTSK